MNQFSELTLTATIHKNLARNGFVKPTPVQAQAIPPALAGEDVVGTAQTGTGKTLAFLLPLIENLLKKKAQSGEDRGQRQKVRSLVLTPTRELAIQIAEAFATLAPGTGLRATVVVGGINERTQLTALKHGCELVIATPGRLEDFLKRRLINWSSSTDSGA